MDQIRQYQQISEVKPRFYKLEIPYHKPTLKRIQFNLKETQLYYDRDNSVYRKNNTSGNVKTGGADKKDCLIYVVDADF